MRFKEFYLKSLNETPHALLFGDEFFDFRREDSNKWLLKLVDLYKEHKAKAKEMTKNLLSDIFFKMAFKTDIKKLPKEDMEKLKKELPKEFFN
jgi:hypothetical protein